MTLAAPTRHADRVTAYPKRQAVSQAPIQAIGADGHHFPIDKLAAHQAGQLHVAISVFVFDAAGRLLLQQRAAGKYHCASQWANSCCSHPAWGERPAAGAHRRLLEELGVHARLTPVGVYEYRADVTNDLIEHERVHLFVGRVANTLRIVPNPDEVAAVRWAHVADVQREARATPDVFTPWFRLYLQHWRALGLPTADAPQSAPSLPIDA